MAARPNDRDGEETPIKQNRGPKLSTVVSPDHSADVHSQEVGHHDRSVKLPHDRLDNGQPLSEPRLRRNVLLLHSSQTDETEINAVRH